jgi:hypothetical protein
MSAVTALALAVLMGFPADPLCALQDGLGLLGGFG